MVYKYSQYKRNFYLAGSVSCLFLLLWYKNLSEIFAGDVSWTFLFVVFLQIIIIPMILLLIGFYFRNIHITTNASEITYHSPFKKMDIKWDKIQLVKRIGWSINVIANNSSFSLRPHITPIGSTIKIKPQENIFKNCELLKEIHSKAINAEFVNFPDDTFPI